MEHSIEWMMGVVYLVSGISLLLRMNAWREWVLGIQQQPDAQSLVFGMISLFTGAFIVAFHPVWEGIALLVTLVGCLAILKGAIYMLFPGWLAKWIDLFVNNYKAWCTIAGIIMVLFAALVFYDLYG